ncbi:MAG: DUF2927 domain-containing protein [Acidimicrobiia bacterium]
MRLLTRRRVLLYLLAFGTAACGDAGSHPAASTRAQDQSTANHAAAAKATDVLGRQLDRSAILEVTPYERDALLELALRPATSAATRPSVLQRWTRSPVLHVTGSPSAEDVVQLAESAQRWSVITGLNITVSPGAGNVDISFVPRADFARVLAVEHVDPTAVGLTRLRIDPRRAGVIVGATVVVADDDLQVSRNRTIAHELGHAVGLQHSTCASSLMDGSSDGDRSVRWSPSPLDLRVGSLVYDRRLQPGDTARDLDELLVPSAVAGVSCDPVDLELVRASGTDRHYLCVRGPQPVRPCTSDLSHEPTLPITNPDSWTDGSSLSSRPQKP